MKEFRLEDLAEFSGQGEGPVYIVHRDRVIDVSNSKLWKGGLHMKRHHAGRDLTTDIKAAPHGAEVLERYPQAGVLKEEEASKRDMPEFLAALLGRVPMLRRHPHPMTVHFPIVFLFSATVFNLVYLFTGVKSFEITALHCLGGGVLFTPTAIATGLFTWWLNYLAKPMRATSIKRRLSLILLATEIVVFIWRILVPDILDTLRLASIVYLLLVLSFIPLVTTIGWFGAHLTFPIEKE